MAKSRNEEFNDAYLLSHVFRDVTPLPGRKISYIPHSPFKPKRHQKSKPSIVQNSLLGSRADSNLPEIKHGDAPGLDKRTAKRLRQGRLDVEARLDLHGFRQDKAHVALNEFLAAAFHTGKRCVLVITGKGTLSPGGGVLKKMVPRWLNETPNRNRILSFNHAKPKDGGNGALYILLKGKRL